MCPWPGSAEVRGLPLWKNHQTHSLYFSLPLSLLDISNNSLDCLGAQALALRNLACLKDLNIASNYLYSEGARILAEDIKEMGALSKLDISKNEIGAEGAKALAQAL